MADKIELGPDRWIHRLIVNEKPPAGVERFTDKMLRERLFGQVKIRVFDEIRENYFLAEFQLVDGGLSALLTLDLYNLDGIAHE